MIEELNHLSKEDILGDDNIFEGYGVEVLLEGEFGRIREILSRMGEIDGKNVLQCCYILHKRGRYAIMHYLELMNLDGTSVPIAERDIAIRNKIADLLEEWELVTFVDPEANTTPMAGHGEFKIIPFKEKKDWNLVSRYDIGRDKRPKRQRRRHKEDSWREE